MITYTYKDATTLEEAFSQLYTILTLLRSEDGCPWDRQLTSYDSALSLIDETYEYLDALKERDVEHAKEEIGDVLLNALMILRIHQENSEFTPVESINGVSQKLIRRHPHVFGEAKASNSEEVLEIWNAVKQQESENKESSTNFFSKIPTSLPTVEKAYEIQKKMAKVGFDWEETKDVVSKIREEIEELEAAIEQNSHSEIESELGDLLFSIINIARFLQINPTLALYRTNNKIVDRFNKVVTIAKERGITLQKESASLLNEIWDEVKKD